jgi:hypothetical protein
MTQEELNIVLEKHRKWLNNEEGRERAYLSGANLSNADLSYANLSDANLSYAILSNANLSGANLSNANLSNANLSGANLSNANLSGANLSDAYLDESEKIRLGVCLEESITGYKKCENGVIVTLKIPEGAIVFSINNSKCRTNIAKVIDIDNGLTKVASRYDSRFIYHKGRFVRAKNFNCQYNEECASGIHFFRTREEAEKC